MIGISGGVALMLLFVVGLIFLAMVGVAYWILGFLPSSSSTDQLISTENGAPSPSTQDEALTRNIPLKQNHWPHAIATGVVWFFLWVIFTNVLLDKPGDTLHRNISAETFGYATASTLSLVGLVWCADWLWTRFVSSKRKL